MHSLFLHVERVTPAKFFVVVFYLVDILSAVYPEVEAGGKIWRPSGDALMSTVGLQPLGPKRMIPCVFLFYHSISPQLVKPKESSTILPFALLQVCVSAICDGRFLRTCVNTCLQHNISPPRSNILHVVYSDLKQRTRTRLQRKAMEVVRVQVLALVNSTQKTSTTMRTSEGAMGPIYEMIWLVLHQ